jgi:uncharacterized protein
MKIRAMVICACLLAAVPAFANDGPPSDASIQQLLDLTNVRQLLDQMKAQLDSMMASAVHDAQQGQPSTPERQAVIDRMRSKMAGVVNEVLSWETLEPIYVRTYRASLTQDELNGIIAFYSSSAGQAFTKKMPLIMQNVMIEMQGVMKPMQQKMAGIQKQAIQELKDLKTPPAAAAVHGSSTS